MNYKAMMISAMLAGSMQQAWAMEEERGDKEGEYDTDMRDDSGRAYITVTNAREGCDSLIAAMERASEGFHQSPECAALLGEMTAWHDRAANAVASDAPVTPLRKVELEMFNLQAAALAQKINVAIKQYQDRIDNQGTKK